MSAFGLILADHKYCVEVLPHNRLKCPIEPLHNCRLLIRVCREVLDIMLLQEGLDVDVVELACRNRFGHVTSVLPIYRYSEAVSTKDHRI